MVDFNNEVTVGTPAIDIVLVLVLQARANVFDSLELYNKQKANGIQASLSVVKARLVTWFLEHQAYFKRSMEEGEYKTLSKDLINGSKLEYDRILEIIFFLNEKLDTLKITKLDIKKQYDRGSLEAENKAHHL